MGVAKGFNKLLDSYPQSLQIADMVWFLFKMWEREWIIELTNNLLTSQRDDDQLYTLEMILINLDLDLNIYLACAAEYILTLNLTYVTSALSIVHGLKC